MIRARRPGIGVLPLTCQILHRLAGHLVVPGAARLRLSASVGRASRSQVLRLEVRDGVWVARIVRRDCRHVGVRRGVGVASQMARAIALQLGLRRRVPQLLLRVLLVAPASAGRHLGLDAARVCTLSPNH